MSASPPPPSTSSSSKKPIRELSSITNHLLLTKTLNALANNPSLSSTPAPPPSTSSIKENIPNDPSSVSQQKALNLRLAAALKPVDRDNVAALLQLYQTINSNNSHSNGQSHSSLSVDNSPSVANLSHLPLPTPTTSSVSKSHSKKSASMTYLCRFNQRNRLIEVPSSSDFYHSQNGISHEHLKQLIMQEFQLHKTTLIIQMWSEQYQEYIDIESYKKIPLEGRLQVLIEKPLNSTGNSPSVASKSPATPISSNTTGVAMRSITPIPLQSTPSDHHHEEDLPSKSTYEEPVSTVSPMQPIENLSHGLMYDLLPKPTDGIPIPRFPPHIAAFLNGNGDANQLNALVQALYQEIVKYELYPNADELRSIVSRLVDRHPNSLAVIGSIELLVRKLYYKFCNERKKYPVELKRRQPNKRKRLMREDEANITPVTHSNPAGRHSQTMNDLDRLMHLWTNTSTNNNNSQSDCRDTSLTDQSSHQQQDGFQSPAHSPSGSSSNSSSPDSNAMAVRNHPSTVKREPFCPLNLSMATANHANLMCTE